MLLFLPLSFSLSLHRPISISHFSFNPVFFCSCREVFLSCFHSFLECLKYLQLSPKTSLYSTSTSFANTPLLSLQNSFLSTSEVSKK